MDVPIFVKTGLVVVLSSVFLATVAAAAEPVDELVNEAVAVTVAQARSASPVRVYQLEQALYEHLEIVARQVAVGRSRAAGGAGEEIPRVRVVGMDRPQRPRLSIDTDDGPTIGAPGATDEIVEIVEITVVENLSQVYSSRLDVTLQDLLRRFSGRVRLVHKDFVLPRHRTSLDAAAAARCARRQGKFWEFRARLLAYVDDQTHAGLLAHADAVGLDGDAFATCLSDPEPRQAAMAETEAVRAGGVVLPPTVLVDGIYFGGVEPADRLATFVASQLGSDPDSKSSSPGGDEDLRETGSPWELTGIVLAAGRRQAMLVNVESGVGRVINVSDTLEPSVTVADIQKDFVVIVNHGRRELVTLEGRPPLRSSSEPKRLSDRALVRKNVTVLPFNADMRARVAANRENMVAQLTPAPLDVDGERLLKLTGSEHLDLFASLGLQPNDVIVRANDEWIFDGRNGLFDAIATGKAVTVVVMRRGIPYLIDLAQPGP
ncbi:MAG: type II secretory pathway component PulC/protein-disulfide isomerase [Hyphomicrobiaceae bacterium]|jgi:type II secretory pathway component PulC/protein-disulfide isomerase